MQSGKNINKERVIYMIKNTLNGKCYIGKTMNFNRRKAEHLSALRNKRHVNSRMQFDFDKLGESSFSFLVLKKVKGWKNALALEREKIEKYQTEVIGYNMVSNKLPPEKVKKQMSTSLETKYHDAITKELKKKNINVRDWLYELIMDKARRDGLI